MTDIQAKAITSRLLIPEMTIDNIDTVVQPCKVCGQIPNPIVLRHRITGMPRIKFYKIKCCSRNYAFGVYLSFVIRKWNMNHSTSARQLTLKV